MIEITTLGSNMQQVATPIIIALQQNRFMIDQTKK